MKEALGFCKLNGARSSTHGSIGMAHSAEEDVPLTGHVGNCWAARVAQKGETIYLQPNCTFLRSK